MRRLLPLLLLVASCDTPPVQWADPVAMPEPAQHARLAIDSAGHARWSVDSAAQVTPPSVAGLCASSLRTVQGHRQLFAVWWSVRHDSSAVLYAAASSDSGRTWGIAAAVDTSDVSSRGCERPAPSPASVGDDLHIVYSMTASEGTGVFFAHFMGSMVHAPVVVVYGDRLVATAIAADGDHVAVAYEDPNGKRQQIDIAYSTSQGHLFDWHSTATRDTDAGTSPSIALDGHAVAVAWTTQRFQRANGPIAVRTGRIR